ncbi:MAG: peptidoglycan DD-metalloendopeptidase family protein [Candidatus Accumulibacter sp.]|jgi:septal ring factor EnvC (AmiA/AmiB activator)|nr:peptidoglycan DD-metalloendopeptidase family protein [Accumulibacter sp.]
MAVIFARVKRPAAGLSPAFRRIVPGLVLAGAVLAATWPALSGEAAPASPTRAEVSEKRGDLMELRAQIESLRKEMAAAEGQRATAADQVKDVEREISTTQRELHALSGQKNRLQTTLKDLGKQARELTERLDELQAQMESLVYRRYLQGHPDALRLLLNGEDPNQMTRDLYYLAVIGHARQQLQNETRALLEKKRALSENMRERAEELSSIEARQKEQHARLVVQREQRKEMLARISSKISQQRKEIGGLQRDEKALARLIARLERIIAAQTAARRERAAKAAPGTRPPAPESASGRVNEHTPEASPSGNFAALKGSLRLPVRGTVTNRYGGARQEGSTWKGLFIRAAQGSDIKAIAGGSVVFADWMRGFGNLMIVDHGDSYLSIYAYNDAMLKQVGDAVRGGDSIATAGNSGGNPESGLYFELRHQGRPVDPMKWVSLK